MSSNIRLSSFVTATALAHITALSAALLSMSGCDHEQSSEIQNEEESPTFSMMAAANPDDVVGTYTPKAASSTSNVPRVFNIAALGDSYGSGEGAPFEAGTFNADGSLVTENGEQHLEDWQEGTDTAFAGACHRSSETGSQLAAEALRAEWSSRVSVDYVNLACSGAAVEHLVSTSYSGVSGTDNLGSAQIPPQVDQLEAHMTNKSWTSLDTVFLSVGGNDALFGDVVTACISGTRSLFDITLVDCNNLSDSGMAQLWSDVGDAISRLGGVSGEYAGLNQALDTLGVNPSHVILSQYPDLSSNDNGSTCTGSDDWAAGTSVDADLQGDWLEHIEAGEWAFATNNLVAPLNTLIRNTATQLGWETLEMNANVTNSRGLCANSGNRLFNQNRDALNAQGDDLDTAFYQEMFNFSAGMVHPNKAGQEAIYKEPLLSKFRTQLLAKLTPTAPKNVHAYAVEASATDGGRNITVVWDDTASSESIYEVKMTKVVSGVATMETGANALNLTFTTSAPSFVYGLKSSGVYEISVRACLYSNNSSIKACSAYVVGSVANVAPTQKPSISLSVSGTTVNGTITAPADPARVFFDIHGANVAGAAYTPFTSESSKVKMPFSSSACGSTAKVRACNLAGCGPYSNSTTLICSL